MWRRRRTLTGAVLLVVVAAVSVVAAEEQLLDVQHVNIRGRQSLVSGTARRQAYRTTYTRETAAHGVNELVPEVINIDIEKTEHTRT